MSKKNIISILGGVIIFVPFLGVPYSISTPLFVCVGAAIIFIARSSPKKK